MSYLQDRKKNNIKIRNVVIVVVVLFALLYFRASVFGGLSIVANKVFKPVIKIGNNIGSNFNNVETLLSSKEDLHKENINLKQELLEIKTRTADYAVILDENNKLKEALGRKTSTANFLAGAILSKPNKSAYDTILVDLGEDQGILVGDLVFALGNIPVGKISEVFSDSAKVTLFSTSGEKTEVVINGKDTFMQLVGRGGGNFEMTLPREFELSEGTEVTLPGINSYLLAKVVTIISDPRDSYKKALLVSPVNIQELKFVQIVK